VATVLFAVTIILGIIAPWNSFLDIVQQLGDLLGPLGTINPFVLFLIIFFNNAIKTAGIIALGILIGLPPVLFVTVNGFVIGTVMSWIKSVEGLEYMIAIIAPHGVIEIPMLLLATALSFMVGWESLNWIRRRESSVKSQLVANLKLYLKIVLPGLAVAAAIEVSVTPWLANLVSGS